MKKHILTLLFLVGTVVSSLLVLAPQASAASYFDGRLCAKDSLYEVVRCPGNQSYQDLAYGGYATLADSTKCIDNNFKTVNCSGKGTAALGLNWDAATQLSGSGTIRQQLVAYNKAVNDGLANDDGAINYKTANCSTFSTVNNRRDKCEAIKACINDANKTQADCLQAWTNCIAIVDQLADGINTCKDQIKQGNLDVTSFPTAAGTDTTEETTCAVDGVGWIVCPLMNFMAKLNDQAFSFLKQLLGIHPGLINDDATKAAWSAFRDIANVAFVIAFMFIVYSQITSVGISNYGIKKLLPRIVIAAILVNLSYIICALMVDISNIVGSSIYSLLGTSIDIGGSGTTEGATWTGLVGGILAAGAVVLLLVIIFLAPTVLLAAAVILLILVARQALIILLIVVSPLAFVAYLLPNTEAWFKRWWKALVATLMVYPIVAIVFGASTLASTVLMNVASDSGGGGDDEQLLKIVALAVLGIPLLAVPALLKGSLAAAGSMGTKIAGLSDRANRFAGKGVSGRVGQMGKGLADWNKERALAGGASLGGGFIRRRVARDHKYDALDRRSKAAEKTFTNTNATSSARERRALGAIKTSDLLADQNKAVAELDHLVENADLHADTINANLNLKNEEGTHRDETEATHKLSNPDQYDRVNEAKDRNSNADLANQSRYADSQAGRALAQTQKVTQAQLDQRKGEQDRDYKGSAIGEQQIIGKKELEGEIKQIDSDHDLTFDASAVGRAQAQGLSVTQGQIDIVHDEVQRDYKTSSDGVRQTREKKIVQGDIKMADGIADQAFEGSTQGKDLAKALQGIEGETDLIRKATKDEFETSIPGQDLVDRQAKASVRAKITGSSAERRFVQSAAGGDINLEAQVVEDQLAAAKSEEQAIISELRAGPEKAGVKGTALEQVAADLRDADTQKRVQTQRTTSAANITNVEFAHTIKGDAAMADVAGGIDPAGATRAVAAATQVIDKQLVESIGMQKTTQESDSVDQLFMTMQDTALPAEKRAAAAGLLMDRGGDQHVQEVLDYMGTVSPGIDDGSQAFKDKQYEIAILQKQVASDIGNRKPQGVGKSDITLMAQGAYGMNGVKTVIDEATGEPKKNPDGTIVTEQTPKSYDDSLVTRLNRGKFGEQELAKMGEDELARLANVIKNRKVGDGVGQVKPAQYDALKEQIDRLRKNDTLKGAVGSPEKNALLNVIETGEGDVDKIIKLANNDFQRTSASRGEPGP